MKVSTKYALVEMKHTDKKIRWHMEDASGIGSDEYTICGLAHTDSQLGSEDFEKTGRGKMGGSITCQDCIRIIKWYKAI